MEQNTIPTSLKSSDETVRSWYKKHDTSENGYYLIVGRFVPENNYETMIREFMASESSKDLVIVTNVEKNKFYQNLLQKTGFDKDKRIKFVGTVYDQPLLRYIRENAYAYLHGHEVGGTNPSLLEALSSTQLNLLIDVGFNRDVGREAAIYWSKKHGNLASVIDQSDQYSSYELINNQTIAQQIIQENYTWEKIIDDYETEFNSSRISGISKSKKTSKN